MSIKFQTPEYKENHAKLIKMSELYAGNDSVKKQGSKYLDKHALEEDDKFEQRLNRSSFYNYLKEALDDSTSKLFRIKPIVDYKVKYDKFINNINGEGDNIYQFLMNVSDKVQRDGHTFVWVDAGSDITDVNWNPYFTQIDRINVINPKYKKINGVKTLVQAVIKQVITVDVIGSEYETKEEEIYIDITAERIKFFDSNGEKVKEDVLNIGVMPLIKIKSGHNMPYEDLADLNLDHYNIYSDLRYNLHMTNTPMYVFHGLEQEMGKDNNVKVGVNKALSFGNKQEEGLEIVEAKGSTIETSRNVLKDIKEEIVKKTSSIMNKTFNTATEANLHDKNSNLLLVDIAINIEKGIEQCISIAEEFYGESIDFKLTLNKDFNDTKLDSQTIFALNTMIDNNSLPLDIFWDTLIDGEIIPDFDYNQAKTQLKEQQEYLNPSNKDKVKVEQPK